MKLLCALLSLAAVLAPLAVEAATGVGTSPSHATVDTTQGVAVSMHRATPAVVENPTPANADEPIRVKAALPAGLAAQPTLAPWNLSTQSGGGVVADGVTPVIFRLVAVVSLPAAGVEYEVTVVRPGSMTGSPLARPPGLSLPGSRVVSASVKVTLTPEEPEACVVLNAIDAEDVLWSNHAGPTVATLKVLEATTGRYKGHIDFGLSRPAVALVHGYNVDAGGVAWGAAYTNELRLNRAPGFVIPVGYGLAGQFNLTGSLRELAALLDRELRTQVRSAPALTQWAWTRHDAVGHSQGGVLLRMLCSQRNLNGGGTVVDYHFSPWRAGSNLDRGRFHRVVTIGSPHAGSTLAEMGWQLRRVEPRVRLGTGLANAVNLTGYLDNLLQAKFRIGNGTAIDDLNEALQCDAQARLHFVGAQIYGGRAPGFDEEGNPLVYETLYLNRQTPAVNGQRPGVVVAPWGSDGVVDRRSQTPDGGGSHGTMFTAMDSGHAAAVQRPAQTEAQGLAAVVRDVLNGPAYRFASFDVPPSLRTYMEERRVEIQMLAQAIKNERREVPEASFTSAPPPSPSQALATPPPPPTGDQTLHFTLQPPTGEAPNGPVVWTAVVFGPEGTATSGLTLATTGTFGEHVALTVTAEVVGQVVLSVSFPSISGQTVVGKPTQVLERPPGVLTGISCNPAAVEGQAGVEIPLVVHGLYDGMVTMPLFTHPVNTTFASSNPAVASVSEDGEVTLESLGTAQITVTYAGTHLSTVPVTVRDVQPAVTSAESASNSVGQPFSYQITASQPVEAFSAVGLPPGLALNAETGHISGTPTSGGRFSAILTVENANGSGIKEVEFLIAGPPGAPTDVSLDAAGVHSGKSVGTVVGHVVTVDPNPLDTFTYQLVSGAGSTDNALFTIEGDALVTAAVLNGAVTSTVSIRVRTTDASGASYEKALVLPVGTPPTITRQPDARQVFAGESAIFFVEATGLEPRQYQWRKDGADVPGATGRIFEIAATVPENAGDYSVVVTNGDGSVTSALANLTVDPISYGKWVSAISGSTAAPAYEPTGDVNGDGVVNFLEFAFGVPPGSESAIGALPFVSRDAFGAILTYREANGVSALTYRILRSIDLGSWSEHIPAVGEATRTEFGAYTLVQVRVPGPNPGVFFTVEVSEP